MKTEIKINVRGYTVKLRDNRTGEQLEDEIFMTKEMLQAGAMVGLSDEDIICRKYNRHGFKVLEISKAHKVECTVDLADLVLAQSREAVTEREFIDIDELEQLSTEGLEIAQEYRKLEAQMDALLDEARELIADMGAGDAID